MRESPRIIALAEAIADGQVPDWTSEGSSAADLGDYELIAKLRMVAAIGNLFATLSSGARSRTGHRVMLAPGATWGTLRIVEHVGRGRFGDVYRAWDPALAREVALKILVDSDREHITDSHVIEEGRLMARVRHEHVIAIHGAQRIDGITGLWMEFVEGRTLSAELADRGVFGPGELAQAGIELSRALGAVHAAALVHRDVKAQNIMRDARGHLMLGDFGTGRELDEADTTRAGLAGTPAYIAPEIFERQPATPQGDLYSLGTLLFHLATRQYPVQGRTLRDLRDAHAQGIRTSLKSLRPDLPAALIDTIETALEVDPSRRFGDAAAMTAALERSVRAPHRVGIRGAIAASALVLLATIAALTWWTTAPRTAPLALAERDWVLVTSAENRTGEAVLDGTIQFALERELAASPVVNVIPRPRLADTLRLMQKPPDTLVDVATGREVALRDGAIRALIAGRVETIGGMYTVSVQILKPADGSVVASIAEPPVKQSDLLRAVSRIAMSAREKLGEALDAIPAPPQSMARVSTSSLRALQLYSQAAAMEELERGFDGNQKVAERLLNEAIKEDPNFPSAYRLLAVAVRLDGERSGQSRIMEALQYAERAAALAEFAIPGERLRNEGDLHWLRHRANPRGPDSRDHIARAVAACEALVQLDRRDLQALVSCANWSTRTGNAAAAIRLAELRPNNFRWQLRAARALLSAVPPSVAEAKRYIARAQTLAPTDANWAELFAMRMFESATTWLQNDVLSTVRLLDQMAAEIPSLPPNDGTSLAEQLARAHMTLGQFKRAESLLATAGPRSQSGLTPTLLVASENRAALRAILERRPVDGATNMSSALIEAGMLRQARQALRLLRTQPRMTRDYVLMIEGQLALAEQRWDDAIAAIEEQLRLTPADGGVMRVWRGANAMAKALAAKGEVQRAIVVLERVPARSTQTMLALGWGFEWLWVREQLAHLYRSSGRLAEADAVERELLELLALADQDHPIKRRLLQQRQSDR